ncbi:MAG TPA: NADH:flavin oxidoreductase, partial [Candidatus Polarisedimenticolia bacterium]|nr:NADH:flavin oxidoreductase [Candidatus Polarisedimenticolia bacterium]
PDWPLKVQRGRPDTIVRCVYGNVCKNLDENFKKVRCVLWPKGALQAPASEDETPPFWSDAGAGLTAVEATGRVHLKWAAAGDAEAVYGYEIYRSADEGPFDHLGSVKGTFFCDEDVIGGVRYRYWVRAYDLAGNRTQESNMAHVVLPDLALRPA